MSSIGLHLGFSNTSCAIAPRLGSDNGSDVTIVPLGATDAWLPTAILCDWTRITPTAVASSSTVSPMADLPRWLEVSQNPIGRAYGEHPSAFRVRTDARTPHAFLASLFVEGNAPDDDAWMQNVDRCTKELAVFVALVMEHALAVASAQFVQPCEHLTVTLPNCVFTSSLNRIKLDAVAAVIRIAVDFAVAHVSRPPATSTLDRISIRLVPSDALCVLSCATQGVPRLLALQDKHEESSEPPSPLIGMVIHIGASTTSVSVFTKQRTPETDLIEPVCHYCSGGAGGGGDAIDQALLHQILAANATAFIENPLKHEEKMLLLQNIRVAKEQCVDTNRSVAVQMVGGGPSLASDTFRLDPEQVERAAVETLFRTLTTVMQQAASTAQSTSFYADSEQISASRRFSTPAQRALTAMSAFRPDAVLFHGRTFRIAGLRKRVESLCRTMGDSSRVSKSVTFHDACCSTAANGNYATWSSTLSEVNRREAFVHRIRDARLGRHVNRPFQTLADDIVLQVHGDAWGTLCTRGASLPLSIEKRVELLADREPSDMKLPRIAAAAQDVPVAVHLGVVQRTDADHAVFPLLRVQTAFPRVSGADGGVDRFAVMLYVALHSDLYDDGSAVTLEVSLDHGASGLTVSHYVDLPTASVPILSS